MSSHYDVFISYKTENANLARTIAELLIANDLSVCFAEYEVPIESWDSEPAVDEFIRTSIDASKHALLLANNKWANSPFCVKEISLILSRLSEEDIAVVHVPLEDDYKAFAKLRGVRQMEYTLVLADVVAFLNQLGWFEQEIRDNCQISTSAISSSAPLRSLYGVQIKVGPCVPMFFLPAWAPKNGQAGNYWYLGVLGDLAVHVHLHVWPYDSPVLRRRPPEGLASSDQVKDYRAVVGYAKEWLGRSAQKPKGVHVFFKGNRSHFAMTSINEGKRGDNSYWVRRYAILFDKGDGSQLEADVLFHCNLHVEDETSAMRKLTQLTPCLDAIVESLEFDPRRFARAETTLAVLSRLLLVLLFARWRAYELIVSGTVTGKVFAFLCGALCVDLAGVLLSSKYRRDANAVGQLMPLRLEILPMLLAPVNRLATVLFGTAGQLLVTFFEGFISAPFLTLFAGAMLRVFGAGQLVAGAALYSAVVYGRYIRPKPTSKTT